MKISYSVLSLIFFLLLNICIVFDILLSFLLQIYDCNLEGNLISVDVLRKKLTFVDIQKSLKDVSTFLLCGTLHWSPSSNSLQAWPIWHCITHANFSHNSLIKIDPSIVSDHKFIMYI